MDKQLQRIKYLRMKPEERFLVDILNKVEFFYEKNNTESLFYRVDGEILFEQDSKNKYFWVSHKKIWSVFESKYGLKQQEIKDLVQGVVWKQLNKQVDTPKVFFNHKPLAVWKQLNKQVDTT